MQPTTRGRYRVHDRREAGDRGAAEDGSDAGEAATPTEEFVLVDLPPEPVAPDDPGAADAYEPVYVAAEGYEGDLAAAVAALEPGHVVEAELAWDDATARFADLRVERRSRFHFADGVEGLFEAAVDAWREARGAGEAVASQVTRSTDGDPNGALYLFADAPGRDVYADLRAGTVPVEPLVSRVNDERGVGERAVFVLRPAAHRFVAVYVVFDADGVLARTVRDTYGIGDGLAGGLSDPAGAGASDDGEAASLEDLDLDDDGSFRNL